MYVLFCFCWYAHFESNCFGSKLETLITLLRCVRLVHCKTALLLLQFKHCYIIFYALTKATVSQRLFNFLTIGAFW